MQVSYPQDNIQQIFHSVRLFSSSFEEFVRIVEVYLEKLDVNVMIKWKCVGKC